MVAASDPAPDGMPAPLEAPRPRGSRIGRGLRFAETQGVRRRLALAAVRDRTFTAAIGPQQLDRSAGDHPGTLRFLFFLINYWWC